MALTHAASGDIVEVGPLGNILPNSISTALFKSAALEVIRMVLPAGRRVPEHRVPGELTLQCIEGTVELDAHQKTQTLHAGKLVRLAGNIPHALHALEDTSLLLTISLKHD